MFEADLKYWGYKPAKTPKPATPYMHAIKRDIEASLGSFTHDSVGKYIQAFEEKYGQASENPLLTSILADLKHLWFTGGISFADTAPVQSFAEVLSVANLTQARAAAICEVNIRTVNRWCTGKSKAPAKAFAKIKAARND